LPPYDWRIMTQRYTPFYRKIGLMAFAIALPLNAQAEDLHLRYEANWGGIHVADFTLSLIKEGDSFENRFHLESRGLTRYFTNLSAIATSRGRIVKPPKPMDGLNGIRNGAADMALAETYIAETYRTEYTNKKHFRWVDIAFGAPGIAAKAVTGTRPTPGREDRWNPKEKGPEVLEKVDPEFRTGVNDPITLIPQIIAIVRAHLIGGPESGVAKGFDGRRRFDMHITHLGAKQRTIAGVLHDTYRVRIVPNPVAGFKNRHKTLWNNSAYDFYLSRDGRFAPLQIVPVNHGPVLTMVAACEQDCEIKAEED